MQKTKEIREKTKTNEEERRAKEDIENDGEGEREN